MVNVAKATMMRENKDGKLPIREYILKSANTGTQLSTRYPAL